MTVRYRPRLTSFHAGLAVLVVAGFALRVWGNRFGLPFLYHEDEGEIVRRALSMPIDGPSPGWFQYPTLFVYVQAAAFAMLWGLARLGGSTTTYAAFAEAATLDPTSVYALGRTFTAVFGAATIATAGAAGRQLISLGARGRELAGFVAAALVCIELLQVEHAHFITADVPMTLASVAALLAVARIAASPGPGTIAAYAIAGALVGLAASIKYPGALFAVAVAAVYVQQRSWRSRRDLRERLRDVRLPAAAAASVAAFVAGSPYVVLDWRTFLRDLGEEASHMRAGHLGFELVQNHWAEVFANFLESGNGVLIVCALAGAVTVFRKKDVFGRSLVVTIGVLLVFAASSNVLFARYLIPMLPVAALLGAHAIVSIEESITPSRRLLRAAVVPLGLFAVLAFPSWLVAHRLALFSAADTRTQAWTWVNTNLREPGSRIAVEWKSIPRKPLRFDIADSVPVVYDVAELRDAGVTYVAVSDRLYRRFLDAPELYPKQVAFYRDLLASAEPVAAFTPFADGHSRLALDGSGVPTVMRAKSTARWSALVRRERSGPVILIFRIGSTDLRR